MMVRMGRFFRGGQAIVAALISLAFLTAPAAASTPQGEMTSSDVTVQEVLFLEGFGELTNKPGHPRQDICEVTLYDDRGRKVNTSGRAVCDYEAAKLTWADGRSEYFVVGTNYAVYHIYEHSNGGTWSGWASMGGEVKSRITVANEGTAHPRLEVTGMNGRRYCSPWTGSGWPGWSLC